MSGRGEREIVVPESRAEWRDWLAENHERPAGVWLALPKKGSGAPGPTYDEAVEEALCFGWVDSTAGKLDDRRSLVWMAPRKRGSTWARTNKARVARLEHEGLLEPAGIAAIERAQADGSWNALDAVDALEVPEDLAAALGASPVAGRHFDAFPPGARRQILWWVISAKRPETRARRVAETVRLAEQNIRANQ